MDNFEKFMSLKDNYKIKFKNERWVRLYSSEQKCFHVERLGETISVLIAESMSGHSTGFKIVGMFDTYEKAVDDKSPPN